MNTDYKRGRTLFTVWRKYMIPWIPKEIEGKITFINHDKINEHKLHKAKELKLFYAYLDWKCSKIYVKSQKNFERWI